jgi:hypothetical protein
LLFFKVITAKWDKKGRDRNNIGKNNTEFGSHLKVYKRQCGVGTQKTGKKLGHVWWVNVTLKAGARLSNIWEFCPYRKENNTLPLQRSIR